MQRLFKYAPSCVSATSCSSCLSHAMLYFDIPLAYVVSSKAPIISAWLAESRYLHVFVLPRRRVVWKRTKSHDCFESFPWGGEVIQFGWGCWFSQRKISLHCWSQSWVFPGDQQKKNEDHNLHMRSLTVTDSWRPSDSKGGVIFKTPFSYCIKKKKVSASVWSKFNECSKPTIN